MHYYSWLVCLAIIIIASANDVSLQTQQGLIYGRQTQNTIEYLG